MRRSIPFALVLFAWGSILHLACQQVGPLGATAAESAYTTALLRCVDDAATLAESRACRQKVDQQWGITEREAGAR